MKVARKIIPALEDCFDATEGQARVRISRHRNTVIVETSSGVHVECSLYQLSCALTGLLQTANEGTFAPRFLK